MKRGVDESGVTQLLSIAAGPLQPELIRDECLGSIFDDTVKRRPNGPAIVDDAGGLTYSGLDTEARCLAAVLRKEGARPGQFVGLWMPRGRQVLIAQLAITITGAAWIPFDADAPLDRVLTCLDDIGATMIVTAQDWRSRFDGSGITAVIPSDAASDPAHFACPAGPDDPAYVIYTSGSTGKPKGIVITQRNICHFLRSAQTLYALGPNDVMLQASSIAFDLSLEEIWVPYLAGAALRIAAPDTMSDPERLATMIDRAGITAIDVVPTLLGLIDDPLPGVRLIILGGEACPDTLVDRFAKPGRMLVNSYGPSEATVVATAAVIKRGEPVTIGGPLPNMTAYVVDEAMQLVPRGTPGQLLLGGPGVAQGYVNRSELTAEKFIANPFGGDGGDPMLYCSGDAVEMDADGNIHFRGRIDDQIKIRGFRVELGEIETVIARSRGVAQAAVVVNKTEGFDQLVAYVVPNKLDAVDANAIRVELRDRMPPYMVPGIIEAVEALPVLAASGKVDRNALAARPITHATITTDDDVPGTPTEAALQACAAPLFPGQPITLDADFFFDLGGHSLLAAQFISAVRKTPALAHITLGNVYDGRSIRAIAQLLDADSGSVVEIPIAPRVPWARRFACGLAQAAAMPFILMLMSAPWLAIFITYDIISADEAPILTDIGLVFLAYMLTSIATAAIALAGKWLILGRTKPGRYPMWGAYYYRVWLAQRLLSLAHLKWFQNTPVLRFYMRLLGARVGHGALISDFDVGAIDLIDIGDHASIGGKVVFANAQVVGDTFVIGKVKVGKDASIGSTCCLESGTEIGEGAELDDLTAISEGMTIPAWEHWGGSPASKLGDLDPRALPAPPRYSDARRTLNAAIYTLLLFTIPAISIIPIVPAFRMIDWLDLIINPAQSISYIYYLPLLAIPATGVMILITLFLVVVARWLLLPRVRAGTYPVDGSLYMRRWAVGLLTECALDFLSSLFATVYMRAWYRMMGAKVGKGTEISTSFAGRYDLIELGAGNFIADDVVLGDDEMRRGWMTLAPVKTGDRVFIGNEAVVPQGYTIESDALIGVKSRPPSGDHVGAGETWFGSPPISLPVRQRFSADTHDTFDPPFTRKLGRAVFEAVNMCVPNAVFITLVTIVMEILSPTFDQRSWGKALLICIVASTIIACVQLLVAAGYKWLMMGTYRPTMRPMWSWWSLRTEAVAVMYWGMAGKVLLEQFRGTPFLPMALRLFGTKTGRGIYMDTADITEFDCVTIGDFAAINNHACLQTHLYEDRLMKVGQIAVGEGVVIGAGTTVLYDTSIGDGAELGPLSMIMKGEAIPARRRFAGSPAKSG